MDKCTVHTGRALPLRFSNVDTDQIIPAEYLKRITRHGYEDAPRPAASAIVEVSAVSVWSSVAVPVTSGAPLGASLTAAMSIVIVLAVASVSLPPTALPPSSCTRKPKLATPAPLL